MSSNILIIDVEKQSYCNRCACASPVTKASGQAQFAPQIIKIGRDAWLMKLGRRGGRENVQQVLPECVHVTSAGEMNGVD